MSLSIALRGARYLSTIAAAAAAANKPISISQTKNRLRKSHDPDEALQIYTNFTTANDSTTATACTRYAQELIVRRLAKSHRYSDIKNFLESHKSKPQITNEAFLSSIIRSYGVADMYENAVNTYNEMTDLGTPRSSFSFNALLNACVHCKMFDRLPVFFDEYPAMFGFSPDKFSYGILIKAYCEMGMPEMAIEKLNEMEEKGIEIGTVLFTTILHGLYNKGRAEEAEKFWDDMVKRGVSPDVACYNAKLQSIQDGKPENMKALIDEMNNAGIKLDNISYNYLITCYCVNEMLDEAEKVYGELLKLKGTQPNSATYRTLIFHLSKKGRYITAYTIFKQSVKMRKIPDFNTLKYLFVGLVKKGSMNEAKGMIRTMNKKFNPNLLQAWQKLTEEHGLGHVGKGEVDSGEAEKGDGDGDGDAESEVEKEKTST